MYELGRLSESLELLMSLPHRDIALSHSKILHILIQTQLKLPIIFSNTLLIEATPNKWISSKNGFITEMECLLDFKPLLIESLADLWSQPNV